MIEVDLEVIHRIGRALFMIRLIGGAYLIYLIARFGFMIGDPDHKYDFNNDPTEWLKYWWSVFVWGSIFALTFWAAP